MDSLYGSVLSNQSDNETMQSDSTALSSNNLNGESRYFEDELNLLRIRSINQFVMGQINMNSVKTKFDDLVKRLRGNIDILMIFKTKLYASFPTSQFLINGFNSPYRLDRNGKGEGILVYFQEDIPSKLITVNLPNAKGFFLEINHGKKKWGISCSYNLHNQTSSRIWKV